MPEFPSDSENKVTNHMDTRSTFLQSSPYPASAQSMYSYPGTPHNSSEFFNSDAENSTAEIFALFKRYLWILSGIAVIISALLYIAFPVSVDGNLDASLGITSEINGRGSAQGNCEMPDSTVATAFKTQTSQVASFYIGAICRWALLNGNGAEVTYAWFESGSLDREKSVDRALGFEVEDTTFQGRPAVQVKSKPESGCALITDYSVHKSTIGRGGIIQFWVQSMDGKFTGDACEYARILMHLTFGDEI